LLEAGHELLMDAGAIEYVDIRLADACALAGYTTGAAYPIWGSQRSYQEDLAAFVVSNFKFAGPESIADELAEIVATSEDYAQAITQATAIYLADFVTRDDFYIALRFWGVRDPSTELAQALAKGYQVVHDAWRQAFSDLLAFYGLRMKLPATIDQMTTILTGLVEGLALRHRIHPELVDEQFVAVDGRSSTLFAEGMIAIVERMTEPVAGNTTGNEHPAGSATLLDDADG
jgi:hypothetical protein